MQGSPPQILKSDTIRGFIVLPLSVYLKILYQKNHTSGILAKTYDKEGSMSRRERMPVEPLSYDQRSYPQVRGGLSGKNLSIRPAHGKRYIWAKSQGVDIL